MRPCSVSLYSQQLKYLLARQSACVCMCECNVVQRLICTYCTGTASWKAHSSAHCTSVPDQHVPRRWNKDVDAVERAAGLHECHLEVRPLSCRSLCLPEPGRSAQRLCPCVDPKACERRLRNSLWSHRFAGIWHFSLDFQVTRINIL